MKQQIESLTESQLEAIAAGNSEPTEEERRAALQAAVDRLMSNDERRRGLGRQIAGYRARNRLG